MAGPKLAAREASPNPSAHKEHKARKKDFNKGEMQLKKLLYGFRALLAGSAVVLLAIAFSPPRPAKSGPPGNEPKQPPIQLSGEAAKKYLEQPGEGQSLMAALTAARFGLQHEEHAPFDEKSGAGYAAMSHDQNLNAWFAEDGVTVRPSLPETKHDQAWSMALRLKRYGYGKELVDVPPIVSRNVKANRIEYVRQSKRSESDFTNRKSQIEDRKLLEWYENRPEGIEQGFTLNERPERNGVVVGEEPLRVLLAVTGDLNARAKDGGWIELADSHGSGALGYSKLIAMDADGKQLAARMEASADGREIALLVEDEGARYPIVIDPIMAALEKKLDANPNVQTDARFGFAVAIDGERAVVGAWREDVGSSADVGVVYTFTRSGNTWSLFSRNNNGSETNDQCGRSVGISGSRIVFGCPGANSGAGRAFLRDVSNSSLVELTPPPGGLNDAGDGYGTSVAISGNLIVVGEPGHDFGTSLLDTGLVFVSVVNSDGSISSVSVAGSTANENFGTSVAIDGTTLVVGGPGAGAGRANVYTLDSSGEVTFSARLQPSSGNAGDSFGNSVAISGNTVVAGAPLDGDKGTNAGAAYVFVRAANGNWSQQQKLTASDATANISFGADHIAIQGNTIVVGANAWDGGTPPFILKDDDRGAAYVFTRSGTVWTQQTQILANDGARGDNFGVGVGVSGNSVIVGARAATASGVARAGAAYVYRLDCVPPYGAAVNTGFGTRTLCPGEFAGFGMGFRGGTGSETFQWRKNGVNIPGATDQLYIINSVSASDAGSYDVVVSNSCGSDISAPVTLTVYSFTLSPNQNFGVSGSPGIVNVTSTGSSCSWTAVSNASFITINSGASGTGNGTVGFTVAANPNSGQRTGTMTIAGLTFTVSQDGTNCSYSIAPTSQTLDANASTKTVAVTTNAGCNWTATSNDSFISINSGANGTGNGTVTYTVAANFNTTQRIGTLTIAGQTFTVTQGAAPGLVANVSTRLPVGQDPNALIQGFIVQGPAGSTKKIIVRALGPFLQQFGITDFLANPALDIFDGNQVKVASNDNWRTTQVGGLITGDQFAEINASGLAPTNDAESAIIANLAPGQYTAVVRGSGNSVGTGLVDAFDLSGASPAKLVNVGTRGLVQPGDGLLTAGFIVQNGSVRVVIRAIGPSLTQFGITNALADTTLQLRDQFGAVVRENDDWQSDPTQKAELEATGLQPTNNFEAALVATIPPGQYTAQVRGKPEATGTGVVEIYFLQ
ncbi:MAG: hypothetical protein DLM73_10790 [Chthoniobacterales bacterium]|nr:MAG: hypothetical protein DLM73_10790 [Chthoniobacterales bacterium]